MSWIPLDTSGDLPPAFGGTSDALPPSPGASGSNVVTIEGNQYIVTQANYSAVARLYQGSATARGDNSYNPNTADGQKNILANIEAFRSLAGLPDLGEQGVIDTANKVLNNPIIETLDKGREAGQAIFTGINNITQGVLGTSESIANITGFLGKIFNGFGGLIVLGAVGFYVWKKFK